jgi:hypothetical protein
MTLPLARIIVKAKYLAKIVAMPLTQRPPNGTLPSGAPFMEDRHDHPHCHHSVDETPGGPACVIVLVFFGLACIGLFFFIKLVVALVLMAIEHFQGGTP